MYWITKYNLFFIALVIVFATTFSVSAQTKSDYRARNISNIKDSAICKSPPANNATKFSIAFLPTMLIREDQSHSDYSTGYGFDIETSYELSKLIKISGSIEAIFAHFKMRGMDYGYVYETTSKWYSLEIGPKFLSSGKYRVFWNFNLKVVQIYHGTGSLMTQTINNPDSKFGYNMGVGAEIPLNKFLTLEVNPLFNILYSLDEGPVFKNYDTYIKISFGLSYNL